MKALKKSAGIIFGFALIAMLLMVEPFSASAATVGMIYYLAS